MNQDYTPANVLNNVVTMPHFAGRRPVHRHAALQRSRARSWGGNQCLWPCRTGTMTTFTEAQETVTISTGRSQLEDRRQHPVLPDARVGGQQSRHVDVRPRSVLRPAQSELQLQLADRRRRSSRRRSRMSTATSSTTRTRRTCPDEWKPAAGLTLNLGLRYDVQTGVWNENHTQAGISAAAAVRGFRDRAATRTTSVRALGVAWDVRKQNGKSVVRGGYGRCVHDDHQRHAWAPRSRR